jgi:hypothetical protein
MGTTFRFSKSIVVLSCWFDFLFLLTQVHWQAVRPWLQHPQGQAVAAGQPAPTNTAAASEQQVWAAGLVIISFDLQYVNIYL